MKILWVDLVKRVTNGTIDMVEYYGTLNPTMCVYLCVTDVYLKKIMLPSVFSGTKLRSHKVESSKHIFKLFLYVP